MNKAVFLVLLVTLCMCPVPCIGDKYPIDCYARGPKIEDHEGCAVWYRFPHRQLIADLKRRAQDRYEAGNPIPNTAYVVPSGGAVTLRWQPVGDLTWTSAGRQTKRNPAGYIDYIGVAITRTYVFVRRWERHTPTERFRQVFGAWVELGDVPALEAAFLNRHYELTATGGGIKVSGLPHPGMYPGEAQKASEHIGGWVVFRN